MKKAYYYITGSLWLALIAIVMPSCSSKFRIEGNILNLGNQNVLMVWATADGVKEVRTTAENGKFKLEGASHEPALVVIYNAQNQLIAHFVMEDGDHTQLRGDMDDPLGIEVKSSDVNERWYKFIADHRGEYEQIDRKRLDTSIEKYVADNTDDMLSTLLLVTDYSQLNNQQKMKSLLAKISPDAKPEWLLKAYQRMVERRPKSASRIGSLLLLEDNGDFGSINATTARATLLYLWVNSSAHNAEMSGLTTLAKEFNNSSQLQICDIYIDPDTASWRGYTAHDGSTWRHFWAPEGPLNSQIKNLAVTTTPLFVVADSLGKVTYNGTDITEAVRQARQLLK